MRVKNKIKTIIILGLLTIGCSSKIISSETWIDYDDVSKISLGASQNKVVSTLGEPILILADHDDGENNNNQMTHVEMGDRAMGIVQFLLDIWV